MNESSVTKIESIQTPGDWIDVKAKVVQLWDSNAESISQVGLLGDETGQIKFISWKKSKLPLLEEGESYLIKTVVVDSWQGKLQLNLNRKTEISQVNEEIEVGKSRNLTYLRGEVESLTPRAGIFLRCPECKRSLKDGVCLVHGEVEPIEDLRIGLRIVTDSGERRALETSGERAERVAKITAEEAHRLSDKEVWNHLKKRFMHKEIQANCFELEDDYLFADNLKILHERD